MKAHCATQATTTGQRNTTVFLCPEHLEFFDRSDKQGRGQGKDHISDSPHLCTTATSTLRL